MSSRKTNHTSLKSRFSSPIYLGAATRTPIGKFGGALLDYSAAELGALSLIEAKKRAPEVTQADWVISGHARQAGGGPNTARQISILSGEDQSTPAFTINQACASGLTAVFSGIEKIAVKSADSIWAGGTESMSNTPYLLLNSRWGERLGHSEVTDGMFKDGFHCPIADMVMGKTVEEYIVKDQKISRKDQDEFALHSQTKATQAWQSGFFKHETVEIPADPKRPRQRKGLARDEHIREDTSLDALEKLSPVFDQNGTITAGNSSGITDGSAFIHLSSQLQSHSQAEVIDFETVALDPRKMGLGPIGAIQNLLKRQSLLISDIDAFEINEAFAGQAIACQRALQVSDECLNPNGGAIALGHPVGASGARVLVTLIHHLQQNNLELGIVSLCVSGGQGVAILIKNIQKK